MLSKEQCCILIPVVSGILDELRDYHIFGNYHYTEQDSIAEKIDAIETILGVLKNAK